MTLTRFIRFEGDEPCQPVSSVPCILLQRGCHIGIDELVSGHHAAGMRRTCGIGGRNRTQATADKLLFSFIIDWSRLSPIQISSHCGRSAKASPWQLRLDRHPTPLPTLGLRRGRIVSGILQVEGRAGRQLSFARPLLAVVVQLLRLSHVLAVTGI
jgi:hypothetical protein